MRGRRAEHDADHREQRRLAQHHQQDVDARGAERQAHADLTRPARHVLRHDPVDPHRRQNQREHAERRRQRHEQPLASSSSNRSAASACGCRRPADPCRRARTASRINGVSADRLIALRTSNVIPPASSACANSGYHVGGTGVARPREVHVAADADDLVGLVVVLERTADGMHVRKEPPDELLIDDRDLRRLLVVARVERPSPPGSESPSSRRTDARPC